MHPDVLTCLADCNYCKNQETGTNNSIAQLVLMKMILSGSSKPLMLCRTTADCKQSGVVLLFAPRG